MYGLLFFVQLLRRQEVENFIEGFHDQVYEFLQEMAQHYGNQINGNADAQNLQEIAVRFVQCGQEFIAPAVKQMGDQTGTEAAACAEGQDLVQSGGNTDAVQSHKQAHSDEYDPQILELPLGGFGEIAVGG